MLNDADALGGLLPLLVAAPLEVIVVDGGSGDGGIEVAEEFGVILLRDAASRGGQLDSGVRAAHGQLIWMLHADARPTPENIKELLDVPMAEPGWGRFDVRLDDAPPLRLVAALMNLRSALTGICTGDQGVFAHRRLLQAVGGVPRQPLMEDVELSKRLRRLARPRRLHSALAASPRRWRERGFVRTILAMWWLRLRYALGAAPETLYRSYYGPFVGIGEDGVDGS